MATSGCILISYRHADASGQAGRLYDRLVAEYGHERVFMDVDGIEPGADFVARLEEVLSSCHVLLPIIGPNWAGDGGDGTRRLDVPGDFVRIEVARALQQAITVIPLLVEGTSMPEPDSLPDDLRSLTRRQAIALDHARWESDMQRVLAAIDRVPGFVRTSVAPAKRPRWRGRRAAAVAAAAFGVVAIGAALLVYAATGSGHRSRLLYEDALTNGTRAWRTTQAGGTCHLFYAPGGYTISVTGQFKYCIGELEGAEIPIVPSVRIEADVYWPALPKGSDRRGAGEAGLECDGMGTAANGNGYTASVSPNGSYDISRYDAGKETVLTVGHDNRAAAPPRQIRHLELDCLESDGGLALSLSVDGNRIASASDASPLRPRDVRMQAISLLDGSIDAVFRNFRVYS